MLFLQHHELFPTHDFSTRPPFHSKQKAKLPGKKVHSHADLWKPI